MSSYTDTYLFQQLRSYWRALTVQLATARSDADLIGKGDEYGFDGRTAGEALLPL